MGRELPMAVRREITKKARALLAAPGQSPKRVHQSFDVIQLVIDSEPDPQQVPAMVDDHPASCQLARDLPGLGGAVGQEVPAVQTGCRDQRRPLEYARLMLHGGDEGLL